MIGRAVVLGILLSAAAHAAPTPESARANAEAQQLFRAGRYVEAVPAFERAHAIDPDPAYLFDIAQAYRLAHACAKAVEYYDRFFAEVPNPPSADKIHGFRDAAAECAKEQAPLPAPIAVPLHPAPVSVVVAPPPPAEPSTHTGTLRTAGLATMAAGAVAAGVGIYFSVRVASLSNERSNLCPDLCTWEPMTLTHANQLDDQGKSAQRWAAVSYAVAGAALAGGVVMYLLGRDPGRATLAAAPQPGGAAVFARIAF